MYLRVEQIQPTWLLHLVATKVCTGNQLSVMQTFYMNRFTSTSLVKNSLTQSKTTRLLPNLILGYWTAEWCARVSTAVYRVRRYTLSRGAIVRKKSSREQWEVSKVLVRAQSQKFNTLSKVVYQGLIALRVWKLAIRLRPINWYLYRQMQISRTSWSITGSALLLMLVKFNVRARNIVKEKFYRHT